MTFKFSLPASIPTNKRRVAYKLDGLIFYPQKPNGNMPAGREQPRRIRGAITYPPPMRTIQVAESARLATSANMPLTRGASSTCTETLANGLVIGMAIMT